LSHRRLDFGEFSLTVPAGWEDITSTLENPDAPLTIADPIAGVGALQFSVSMYESGKPPSIGPQDLLSLLDDFAVQQGFDDPFDFSAYSDELMIEGASFHAGENLIRVWYATDGQNMMLITYVCDRADSHCETSQIERSVQSIRFADGESR
jgi:hypothetical protein